MNTATTHPTNHMAHRRHEPGVFAKAEAWLDARGKPAWIIAMVAGFIVFWPIGLALLAYMIWSKRMFNGSCAARRNARAMPRHGLWGGTDWDVISLPAARPTRGPGRGRSAIPRRFWT